MQHVFIVGAKSLGAYGGYETFVNKLTEYHQSHKDLQYHIACKANGDGSMDETKLQGVQKLNASEFVYHNAHCFKIQVPNIGAAQAILYDVFALQYCCKYIKEHEIKNPIVYILACRIGPVISCFQKKIQRLGGELYINPDGHEWKRSKWSVPIRAYWKLSEKLMVKYASLVVCDSVNIERYISESYGKYNPRTTYIAYGAESRKSKLPDDDARVKAWYEEKKLQPNNYYLIVGRFVPENNYETMIREFVNSKSQKDLAIITNVNDTFIEELEGRLHFKKDSRIKFVGTVYEQELLMKIRENAYAYFHGHEVGGTNPSLLEALGSTNVNLLLNVGFNREVAGKAALYWNKDEGNLARLIHDVDQMSEQEICALGSKAKRCITQRFSWQFIADEYEKIFLR